MNIRIARTFAAAVIAATLPLFSLVSASPAQALTAPASSAAGWLSQQLTSGLAHNPNYGGFDDYGLSLDIFFALDALDAKPASARSIIDALQEHPDYYIGSGLSIYAGSVGKLAAAVQLDGRDATHFGGIDLIAAAEDRVATTGAHEGRASDSYDPNDPYGADYSNEIGQAWIVRALATAHSSLAGSVTDYLLKQQCSNGSVREALDDVQCTSGTGSIDATSFAIQALVVARDNGISGLGDDIDRAVAWLSRQQASNGSFADAGSANTNSTGLAASVIAERGHKAGAQKAAKWILKHQVTAANAGTKLKKERGAIAYDAVALKAGKSAGITDATRDQWRRATAQAAVGINIALPSSGGSSSGGGSSNGSGGNTGTTGSTALTGTPAPTPTPTPADTPTPTDTPTPAETADPDGAASATTKTASDDTGGSHAGWIVAGIAGVLILGTGAVVGIGRLRGGGTP